MARRRPRSPMGSPPRVWWASRASTRGGSRASCAISGSMRAAVSTVDLDPTSRHARDGHIRHGWAPTSRRVSPRDRSTRPRPSWGPRHRPRSGVPRRRLRLRHETEHPAPSGGQRHRDDRVPGRRPRRPRSQPAGSTGCSSRTVRAIRRRRPTASPAARSLLGHDSRLRHLPRAPVAWSGAGRTLVQDAVRASRREPARQEPADRHRGDHEPQPRVRDRRRWVGPRRRRARRVRPWPRGAHALEPQRRHARGAPVPRRAGVRGAVPPRSGAGAARFPVPVRRLPRG